MKKIVLSAVFLFVFCFVVLQAGLWAGEGRFAGIPYKSATWDAKSINELNGNTINSTAKVMYKENKMRTEAVTENSIMKKPMHMLGINTLEKIYMINEDQKTGTMFSAKSKSNPDAHYAQMMKERKNAKYTGDETINGVSCGIYTFVYTTDTNNQKISENVTEWRNKDGFDMKMIVEAENIKITTINSNLKINPELPDSLFVPDADIEIKDMDKEGAKLKDSLGSMNNSLKKMLGQ